MGILKKALIVLAALAALVVLVGLFLPKTAHVERSLEIAAPECTVRAQIDDFQAASDWSPWLKIDPDTEVTFAGPAHGVGAQMTWKSEDPWVGSGSQEILESSPGLVRTKLDFGPQGQAEAFFRLDEIDRGTRVTWGFDSTFDKISQRYFGLLMDRMLGPQYEDGLAALKTQAEALPDIDWCDLEFEPIEAEAQLVAYASGTSGRFPEEVGAALGVAFGQVSSFIARRGLEQAGMPLTINDHWNEEQGYGFDAAIPIGGEPAEPVAEDSPVQVTHTYAGPAIKFVHRGSYSGLEQTYSEIEAYLAARRHQPGGRPWEVWVSDPGTTAEEDLVTHIFFPIS